jgi:hypothetical protein
MPADVSVRAYRDGDETAILDLFARSFPHAPRTLEHFDWKYRRNPFGSRRISLAWAGGALAGHYAGYAVPFRAYGRDFLAHQIGDTMTDVAVRHIGRGPSSVLGRTALDFYSRFCEGQVAFNYGFNVANIQKFSLRFLRSDRVEPVSYRTAPALPPIARGQRWLRGYSFEHVRHATGEFDALFDRVSSSYRFCVRRTAEYVNWRYLAAPDAPPYAVIALRKWRHLVGWVVFRVEGTVLRLGDLLLDPDFPDALEVALRHLAPAHGAETFEGWFPPRPRWLHTLLEELGFGMRPEPQNLSVMCVPFAWPEAVEAMRRDLYYTWGDSDLF